MTCKELGNNPITIVALLLTNARIFFLIVAARLIPLYILNYRFNYTRGAYAS